MSILDGALQIIRITTLMIFAKTSCYNLAPAVQCLDVQQQSRMRLEIQSMISKEHNRSTLFGERKPAYSIVHNISARLNSISATAVVPVCSVLMERVEVMQQ